MAERVDGFVGTATDYTSYLERELLTVRQQLSLRSDLTWPARATALTSEPAITRSSQSERQAPPNTPTEIPNALEVDNYRVAKRKRTTEPYWMRCANTLIAQTPKAECWSNSLKKQGIHDIMTSGNAVACLLDSKFEPRLSVRVSTPEEGEVAIEDDCTLGYLRIYAQTTAMRWTLASTALALANFQKFLVLSACAVLMEGETPIARILDIVRICVGENSSDAHCRRTVAAAKYLNVLMDTLNIHKWGHRASELPLLWNRAPTYYYHLACSRNRSLEYLRAHLCVDEFTSPPSEMTRWTPIFIPSLVHHILGKQTSIERVSYVLGYQKAHMLAIRKNAWDLSRGR